MPRIARKNLDTSFFHIIVQGINKEYIFNKTEHKEKYLSLLIKYSEKYAVKIISYCVMSNHAHVLVYVENIENMSKFMKCTNTSYGHYYNKKEHRVGIVFRNRYLSQAIYNESYLLKCIAYVHNNPVSAKMVRVAKEYAYSSYNQYLNKNGIVTEDILRLVFGTSKDYLDTFFTISCNDSDFFDIDKETNTRVYIEQYCQGVNNKLEEIVIDENKLKKLAKYLVYEKKVSRIETAELLNTYRQRISRLLKM